MTNFNQELDLLNHISTIDFFKKNITKIDASLLNVPGVYILQSENDFGRLNGKSKVLYIGCSGKRKNQAQGMIKRLFNTRSRKYQFLIEKIQSTTSNVKIKVAFYQSDRPEELEAKLLLSYLDSYFELPPLNSQMPFK
jgi:hypothetical protein